jgi:arylsulfatase A-like enzyme
MTQKPTTHPGWPVAPAAPEGAPSILLILLDDIGFAAPSTFGGPAQTPHIDRLAAQGLIYNNFNNTSMCSPTRAALLTGHNHHRVGFGVAESSAPQPGYNTAWKKSTVSIAEVLRRNGYGTAVFGKWHNTPHWEISAAGPFTHWPTSLGFDYYYGFMAGMENHWEPSRLYRNTRPVEPWGRPDEGYHLTTDIANEAVDWLATHTALTPDRPYFLYFSTGALHSPHHAPREFIEAYRGRFDRGWDVERAELFARQKQLGVIPPEAELTPRPPEIPAWDDLSADQKLLYTRQMEVYAGFIAHTDHEVGRVVAAAQSAPGGENTIIMYAVGDNGASTDPGPDGATDAAITVQEQLEHLDDLGSHLIPLNWQSKGWSWLESTPFQFWKTIASHFGGVRNPLVVSWPARIDDLGGVRSQFTHVNDVPPTLYDITGIAFPDEVDGVAQQPMDGVSFAHTFAAADAPSHHRTQYFEMLGHRAMYHDGWIACYRNPASAYSNNAPGRWELYRVTDDFSQNRDLAAEYPERVEELRAMFEREALANDVDVDLVLGEHPRPALTDGRDEIVYGPGLPRISETGMPPLRARSHRITARVTIPPDGAEGILMSCGGRESGFVLSVRDGRLVYEANPFNRTREVLVSTRAVGIGEVELGYEFEFRDLRAPRSLLEQIAGGVSSGIGRLSVDGEPAGEAPMPGVMIIGGAGPGSLGIGRGFGSPVSDSYRLPFAFTGILHGVTVNLL